MSGLSCAYNRGMEQPLDIPRRAYRDVWIGYYLALGFSQKEIADWLGCSKPTVNARAKVIKEAVKAKKQAEGAAQNES